MYNNDWPSLEKGRLEIYNISGTHVFSSTFWSSKFIRHVQKNLSWDIWLQSIEFNRVSLIEIWTQGPTNTPHEFCIQGSSFLCIIQSTSRPQKPFILA